jgi:hypothetical protein
VAAADIIAAKKAVIVVIKIKISNTLITVCKKF